MIQYTEAFSLVPSAVKMMSNWYTIRNLGKTTLIGSLCAIQKWDLTKCRQEINLGFLLGLKGCPVSYATTNISQEAQG